MLKHLAYSAGWKKFERLWGSVIRLKQLTQARPLLEAILSPVGRSPKTPRESLEAPEAARPTRALNSEAMTDAPPAL